MIKRTIYPFLKEHLAKPEITLITGPRQSGKTTLLEKLITEDEVKGNYLYLNLDKEVDFEKLKTQAILINYLKLNLGSSTKKYVFIDEIQRKSDAGLFLKGIYDSKLPYKFIVSGSGSIELKEKIAESLAGRKRVFRLSTISFGEFVDYKTDYQYTTKLGEYLSSEFFDQNLLEEYLWFGGYPRVVTTETKNEKIKEMEEIYESYLNKDLKDLLNIKRPDLITDLLTRLAMQTGSLVNFSDIKNDVKIDFSTLKTYLYYLEKTFILSKLSPFYKNPATEITKSPIFLFNDLGLRNYSLNRLAYQNKVIVGGMLFENFVYLLLKSSSFFTNPKINFWRTINKAEVDFVVRRGGELIPVEVKFKDLKNTNVTRSLSSFIDRYQPRKAVVVNLSLSETRVIKQTKVQFISYLNLVGRDTFDI